jgi:simple sugar transport system substrate-binding protein
VPIAEDVPADIRQVDAAGRSEGRQLQIWKGPIVDNTGKTVLDKDAAADDKFLTGINPRPGRGQPGAGRRQEVRLV